PQSRRPRQQPAGDLALRAGFEPADGRDGNVHLTAERKRSDRDRSGRVLSEPHLLDIVEGTGFRMEDVDDDVAGVDQHPIAMRQAFNADIATACRLEVVEQPIGDGADMALRSARGNDHEIAENGFADEIDRNDVLSFCLFEAFEDHFQGVRRREIAALGRPTGSANGCAAAATCGGQCRVPSVWSRMKLSLMSRLVPEALAGSPPTYA